MGKKRPRRPKSAAPGPSPEHASSESAATPAHSRAGAASLPQTDAERKPFTPEVLDKTVIAIPLLEEIEKEKQRLRTDPKRKPAAHPVIIDLNLEYPGGRQEARRAVLEMIEEIIGKQRHQSSDEGVDQVKGKLSHQYVFASLKATAIEELARRDEQRGRAATRGDGTDVGPKRAIYHIWPDFEVEAFIDRSVATVKADAARNAFSATGEGIAWAVMDSGIDGSHPHFQKHGNLQIGEGDGEAALKHRDFTVLRAEDERPLEDAFGHGTHVAGIIAGEMTQEDGTMEADIRYRDEFGQPREQTIPIRRAISGVAPKCKLLSLKVLNDRGVDVMRDAPKGRVSNIIAAIEYIQEVNGYGRRLRVHGVNMSVGYTFEPRWFACGQSPLCTEVDRLVRSGVVVVVAAGNTGYSSTFVEGKGAVASGMDLTINDPGNADLAITVGSTHRHMPHVYGISYFSSKGPTGDGRMKPDLVAPGEKIISADSTQRRKALNLNVGPPVASPAAENPAPTSSVAEAPVASGLAPASAPVPQALGAERPEEKTPALHAKYHEDSGTSMAAPHVSGAIAAFLSIRGEFIGRPERVKEIFCSSATDLRRERYFQGHGLLDLMRALQAV